MQKVEEMVKSMAQLAKNASARLATLTSEEKINALKAIATNLKEQSSYIKAENAIDVKLAKENGTSEALIDRLTLTDRRINDMIEGVLNIASQSDPVGQLITSKNISGMELKKVRVPIGVIGIIFESRPNIVSDVAALCLKSGNAVILRGGSEAEHSNRAIINTINQALERIQFTPFAVQMIPIKDRECIKHLCQQDGLVDLIIPRGGENLIKAVADCATVPVIKHYKGICHIYVDEKADEKMALDICLNAKASRPGVCNAAETFLVHENIAKSFLPKLFDLFSSVPIKMLGDEKALTICSKMDKATEEDWSTEYLDLIISIKVVASLKDAIRHINHYGSHHSDAIVSTDKDAQQIFCKEVDSAAVYINASTRFTDGAVFGLGAEMGISTDKLHARGPMGIVELTSYKWIGVGNGHIRT